MKKLGGVMPNTPNLNNNPNNKQQYLPVEGMDKGIDKGMGKEHAQLELSIDEMEEVLSSLSKRSTLPGELVQGLQRKFIDAESDREIIDLYRELKHIENERLKLSRESLFIEDLDENPELDGQIERIIERNRLIGEGKVAKVLRVNGSCIKLIYNPELYEKQNKIADEVAFQEKFYFLAQTLQDTVKVPVPYFYRNTKNGPVISMETISGITLQEMIEEHGMSSLRDRGFDRDIFFDKLRSFIEIANENGLHHRDLHLGNVMIQFENLNTPVVIDFGTAKKTNLRNEEVTREKIYFDGEEVDVLYKSDRESLEDIKGVLFKTE